MKKKLLISAAIVSSLALANPAFADSRTDSTVGRNALKAAGYGEEFYDCVSNPTIEQCGESAAKIAISEGVERAIIAGAGGVTGATTLYVIGAPVAATLGFAVSPVIVGGVIVAGVGYGVSEGVTWLFFDD